MGIVFGRHISDRLFNQLFRAIGRQDRGIRHLALGAKITTRELMEIFHGHGAEQIDREESNIGTEGLVEREQKRLTAARKSRVRKNGCAKDSHRGFAASSRSKHDLMPVWREVNHILLTADRFR